MSLRPVAAGADPTIELSTTSAAVGDTIIVTLSGWDSDVTVSLCGNGARRGAVDCDQPGATGVPASLNGPQRGQLVIAVPPAKCPCVVRAATAAERTVKTVPIDVAGVGTAPVVEPGAPAPTLSVDAVVRAAPTSFFTKLQSALGGRTRRTLVLKLTNGTDAPINGITSSAAVARSTQGGEPLQLPNLDPIPAGQTRTFEVAVSLPPPSFGSYTVYGTIYGAGTPVPFAATTRTAPWGLFVFIVLLVIDLIAIAVLRGRRRRAREGALRPSDGNVTSRETETEQTYASFPGSRSADMVGGDALQDT
jgi:hypothetical protein